VVCQFGHKTNIVLCCIVTFCVKPGQRSKYFNDNLLKCYTSISNMFLFSICAVSKRILIIIMIIIIASHEDEMNDKYNDKLCTRNEVIQ